jgi:hypothetical protein
MNNTHDPYTLTPAPWTVQAVELPNGSTDYLVWGQTDIVASAGPVLADARLIAAAPDLLAACKMAQEFIEGRESFFEDDPMAAAMLEAKVGAAISRAIQKATELVQQQPVEVAP